MRKVKGSAVVVTGASAGVGRAIAREFGWVNNAMVSVFSRALEMKPEEYRRVMEVNFLGYVHGTLAAVRRMRERGGVVIQIGSALAYRSIPLQSAYCSSKAAVRGFTDALRTEFLHDKVPVKLCQLELPAVNTPQFDVVRSLVAGAALSAFALGRWGARRALGAR